jgi:hypothetical protein
MNGNDGRFPDGSAAETRFPVTPSPKRQPGQSEDEHAAALRADMETWPWLAATIGHQCGPDEWEVVIEDRRVAQLDDGTLAPEGTPDDDLLFPVAWRDSSEIRKPQQGGTDAG